MLYPYALTICGYTVIDYTPSKCSPVGNYLAIKTLQGACSMIWFETDLQPIVRSEHTHFGWTAHVVVNFLSPLSFLLPRMMRSTFCRGNVSASPGIGSLIACG